MKPRIVFEALLEWFAAFLIGVLTGFIIIGLAKRVGPQPECPCCLWNEITHDHP